MTCAETGGDANNDTAGAPATAAAQGAGAPTVVATDSSSSSNNNIADTARRWWWHGTGGVRVNDGWAAAAEAAAADGDEEGGERGEDWWAGEEFEEDWACVFEAYCPEGGSGRMPCLVAREVGGVGGLRALHRYNIIRKKKSEKKRPHLIVRTSGFGRGLVPLVAYGSFNSRAQERCSSYCF